MAFVKIKPETSIARLSRNVVPIEFGVGARCGAPRNAIFDVKLRLRPRLLAVDFLVVGTHCDISFDADERLLRIEPGADFKLFCPGGPVTETSPLVLAFPLLRGVRAERFVLPVTKFKSGGDFLEIGIPGGAFVAPRPAAALPVPPAAPAAALPVPVAHSKRPHPGFDSVLANVPHNVRRGA